MDIVKAMRTLICVADEGSFAAAARTMDAAPAVVTRHIAELERHVGARLIHRTTRRLALTEVGKEYLEQARAIVAQIEDASARVASTTRQPAGMLRIGGSSALLSHQIAQHLPEFHKRFPKVSLALTVIDPRAVSGIDEAVDVTLITSLNELQGGDFVAHRIATSKLVFCASPAYLEEHGEPRHPSDLDHHNVLVPVSHITPHTVTFTRRTASATPEVVTARPRRERALNSMDYEPLHAAALAGMGIIATLSGYAEASLAEGKLVRVLKEWDSFSYTLYAAMPSRELVPPRNRAFIEFLKEKLGEPAESAACCE